MREKNALDYYLKHHDVGAIQSEQDFINSQKYKELLSRFFIPLSQELVDWQKEAYEKNTKYPEGLLHRTASGNYVRSKSEALIDLYLTKNRIPFRYEAALYLRGVVIFPDFTIRHPETGEIFYWEHFGLMDESSYNRNVGSKLQLYISNGIIPNIHLITTYETKGHPLTTEIIERILETYFLPAGKKIVVN